MTTIYLGGPINGATDDEAHGWRDSFKASLPGEQYQFLDPMDRDYRGREDEPGVMEEIVELDKEDIDATHIFLAYCWQASWGTAMEIFYAWHKQQVRKWMSTTDNLGPGLIIVVVPEGARISPWLRYHSNAVVGSLSEAQALIESFQFGVETAVKLGLPPLYKATITQERANA